jgi:hypothetical protein
MWSSQYQKWLQYAIIGGVFLLSLLVAFRPSSRLTLLVVGVLAMAVVSIILIRNMVLGLLGVIVACLLIPNFLGSGGLGATLSPPILLLVLVIGLWALKLVTRQREGVLFRSRTTLPAIVFILVSLVTFLNGQVNYYVFAQLAPLPAQVGGLAVFILSVVAFLAAANLFDKLRWLKIFTWLFIIISAVYIFGRLVAQAGTFILPLYQYGSDTSIFWIWLVAISSSQAFFNNHLDRRWRWVLACILVATFYVALGQAYIWKSGWLPPLIALFVILWIGIPRIRIPGLVIVGVAILLFSFGKLGNVVAGGEDYSIMTRVVAWRIVLEIAKVNPILGLGMSNYYWYTPLFPILGYYVQFNSHNNYIDIIAQTGLLGLAVFMWFVFELGRVGWNLVGKVPHGFSKAYVIGALGGLAGTIVAGMLGDWIIPFVYNVGMHGFRASLLGWLFLGGLVALENIYRNLGTIDLEG